MDNRARTKQMLTSRVDNHSLPREAYCDEAVFQLDLETIFYREWLFVGHAFEIPKTGDYLTYDVGQHSLIIIRGRDDQIRALHNVCRHRGSRLCENKTGRSKKLVCPYHQWTYNIDGSFFNARDMGDIDRSQYGLNTAHCHVVGGYIFINLSELPPDISVFSHGLAPYLNSSGLQQAKVAHETRIVENGNWKLVWENFRECYHCDVGHPELAKTFPSEPFSNGQIDLTKEPLYQALWQRCESAGVPCNATIADDVQYRINRAALHGASMTATGEPAVTKLMGELTEPSLGSGMILHHPSTWGHVMADHALSFRVTPLAHDRTELVTKWLVHEDAVEGEDYDLNTLTEVWDATNRQDSHFVGLAQQGINSPAYQPGPYSETREIGTREFADWYCKTMHDRLARS